MIDSEIEQVEKDLLSYTQKAAELERKQHVLTLRLWRQFFIDYLPKLNSGVETSYKFAQRDYCHSRIDELDELLNNETSYN